MFCKEQTRFLSTVRSADEGKENLGIFSVEQNRFPNLNSDFFGFFGPV